MAPRPLLFLRLSKLIELKPISDKILVGELDLTSVQLSSEGIVDSGRIDGE